MSDAQEVTVKLTLEDNYLFKVDFGEFGDIYTDEPEPLGQGEGPNPVRLLVAAVANCLAASLMFALRKQKNDPGQVTANVKGVLIRQDKRWRVGHVDVAIQLGNQADDLPSLDKALQQFEDFCLVTQSVRSGIEVNVTVFDCDGVAVLSQ